MARPRIYKTHGIVLKHLAMGEADRLITLYTPDRGKLRAVARGVRRTRSRLRGHLEPLTHVAVSVAEGRSLDTVTEAQTVHSFRRLREELRPVFQAVYLADLVDGFSADRSPSPAVFDLLLGSLDCLQGNDRPGQLIRHFEVQLLSRSGFGPELYRCVECRASLEPGDHVFSNALGGVVCPACKGRSGQPVLPISLRAIKVLRYFQREPYDRAAALALSPALLAQMERLLREYIRYVLDREPKSAEFMGLVASVEGR